MRAPSVAETKAVRTWSTSLRLLRRTLAGHYDFHRRLLAGQSMPMMALKPAPMYKSEHVFLGGKTKIRRAAAEKALLSKQVSGQLLGFIGSLCPGFVLGKSLS